METLVSDELGLAKVVKAVAEHLKDTPILLLKGELGSGKTTFAKQLLKSFGITDNITSPTFNIVSEYRLPDGKPLYHFDLYRIESTEELYEMGFEEYIDSGNLCVIEWPEVAEGLFEPGSYLTMSISITDIGREYQLS